MFFSVMDARAHVLHAWEGEKRETNPKPGFDATKWNVIVPILTPDKIATLDNKIIFIQRGKTRKREYEG